VERIGKRLSALPAMEVGKIVEGLNEILGM